MGNTQSSKFIDYKSASSARTSILNNDYEHLEKFWSGWLVWLGPHTDQNETLKQRLREYIPSLITFNDLALCEEWLKTRPIDDKILLIASGELGSEIVPNIHRLTSVVGIYIFCSEFDNHLTWTQNYTKIREIVFTEEGLVQQVSKDQIYFDNIEASKAIKIFNGPAHTRIFDLENTPFICNQLLLEILISSSYLPSPASPAELIKLLRRSCSDDQQALDLIKQFEKMYLKNDALTWLNDNTPIARFVNKALREENISMLFYLRFFLIDIYNQLIKHQSQSVYVYRKQIMSINDIENIRANINNYLTFNEVLYTSTVQSQVPLIDANENQLQTVDIEIDAENRDETSPFACIEQVTNINHEVINSKVVFMCGSIFKIISLRRSTNKSWTLKLVLVGNKELNLLADKKEKLRQNKDLLMVVELLDQYNQSDMANIYCQRLLRELPAHHILVPKIRELMNINTQAQTVTFQYVQFIFMDLTTRLTPLASAMLNALRRITNDSILICDKISDIDFDTMSNKTIWLFASKQAISSMTKRPSPSTQFFILEDGGYTDNQIGHFTNSEDLIFQLADDLYRCYKWESKGPSRADDAALATEKEKLAEQIHKELKKVQREFSEKGNKNEMPVCATTIIVYLKSKYNAKNNMANIETLLKNIVSSFLTFDDAYECFQQVCTNYCDNVIFLIIDNDYRAMAVDGFRSLNNVKKIYRYEQSLSAKESTNGNYDIIYVQLTQDLMSHYYRLGTELKDKNYGNNAKDMFLKAQQLCELLNTFFKP